jgi:hypothetical protein
LLVDKAEVTAGRINPRFGAQSLAFNYVFVDSGAYPESHIASVDWRFSGGPLTLYGERAWNKTVLGTTSPQGHATYFGTVISKGEWSLLLEYKDYDYKARTPFQNPATVYRELGPRLLQARDPHVMNISDEVGYQAELSGQATPTTFATLHVNMSSRHRRDAGGLPAVWRAFHSAGIPLPTLKQADQPFWEAFVSAEQNLADNRRFLVELGVNEEAAAVWQERKWLSGTLWWPLAGKQDLEFETQTMLVHEPLRDRDFTDQLLSLGWSNGGSISLTVGEEFTTDKELKAREGSNWPSVEAAFLMNSGKHRLSLFYGRERGGMRCSNGVCRQVQAFSGVRVNLESSF